MKRAFQLLTVPSVLIAASLAAPHQANAQSHPGKLQIAQLEIGVFIDSRGRRVYYDLNTDKILSIEETPQQRNNGVRIAPTKKAPANRVAAPKRVERAPLDSTPQQNQNPPPSEPGQRLEPREPTQVAALPRLELPDLKTHQDITKLQILLDRKGISPGVIDGQIGSNVRKALAAALEKTGTDYSSFTPEQIDLALETTGGPAFIEYVISPDDLEGPFTASIPVDYALKAELPALAYTSPIEMLAERFHMDQNYLRTLNPDANFDQVGTKLTVVNPGDHLSGSIARIEADKAAKQVRAYDSNDALVVAYPSTIGSAATPSPSGTVTIERIALNPNYTYNPKINFTQGSNRSVLTIPPGPNGPVGSVWLALSKPTYGIHGTPEPARIGKTSSHGCIRLTNWDAEELAKLVEVGVSVEFLE